MKSDLATTDMLLKEAINTSRASIYTTTYKGLNFRDNEADIKVSTVLEENNITPPGGKWANYFERKIGNDTYTMKCYKENTAVKFYLVDKTGETDPYKKVLLDKSVNITVKDNAGNDLSGDIKIAFDKANGSVKSVNGSSPVSGTVYTINVESTKNSSKTKDVTLVATTGRHYTEK